MPLVDPSDYQSPWWLKGGHLQTVVPALFRKSEHITTQAERLELPDGDFLDLEWKRSGSSRLAILCHGLEASCRASYIQRMAQGLVHEGWDVLAWSYRGCSGEMNRKLRFYHSGATEDLAAVVDHCLESHDAKKVDLLGFSLGGNMILKYLGEREGELSPRLHRAVTFSVPCDLACSARAMDTRWNRSLYMRRFIRSLAKKVRAKRAIFPECFDLSGLDRIRTFREFDDRFTAPLHGFQDAADYWEQSSSKQYLGSVSIPALLVSAANDPFLGPGCYPHLEAKASDYLSLEVPQEGGHVGFASPRRHFRSVGWREERALRFLKQG